MLLQVLWLFFSLGRTLSESWVALHWEDIYKAPWFYNSYEIVRKAHFNFNKATKCISVTSLFIKHYKIHTHTHTHYIMLIFTSIHCNAHTHTTLHQCLMFCNVTLIHSTSLASFLHLLHTSPATYSPNTQASYTFILFAYIYMIYTTQKQCRVCNIFIKQCTLVDVWWYTKYNV